MKIFLSLNRAKALHQTHCLESFKSTDRAVLLGTRSFWEGVDVPGDLLSVVVITKLPFDVPSDPDHCGALGIVRRFIQRILFTQIHFDNSEIEKQINDRGDILYTRDPASGCRETKRTNQ
ncbi:MAG: helicase C-terminal domain-containing protein [Trichococcus flocculiformis]